MYASKDAQEALRAAEAVVTDAVEVPRTLAPDRSRASRLTAVVDRLASEASSGEVLDAFALGLAQIATAQVRHFPETIFWDIDAMAAELLRGPAGSDAELMRELTREIAALQAQYGRESVLAFRYIHDFTYGYDWVKWVARDEDARRDVRPFSPEFVNYLRGRGAELVELIAQNDDKYPKLPNGRPRNPFGFSRDPGHEATLFEAIARDDALPIRAWSIEPPRFDPRPFADIREACAESLGIPTKSVGG